MTTSVLSKEKFTGFLFLGGITGLIVNKIDFLMISAQKNLSDTAIYSIGFYLALLIEIPKRTIQQISTPIIAQHMRENNMVEVKTPVKTDFQIQCLPNQVTDQATLRWMLKTPAEVRCELTDIQGRLLQTVITPTFLQTGTYAQTLRFESLRFGAVASEYNPMSVPVP